MEKESLHGIHCLHMRQKHYVDDVTSSHVTIGHDVTSSPLSLALLPTSLWQRPKGSACKQNVPVDMNMNKVVLKKTNVLAQCVNSPVL